MKEILVLCSLLLICAVPSAPAADPLNIGGRLELLVDDYLIEEMRGETELRLHRPIRREVAMVTDAPWEGNACHYRSVFQDGDLYRMYYSGLHYTTGGKESEALGSHPFLLCYAESNDGIHWTKPELGIVAFNGSKANNIILSNDSVPAADIDPVHCSVWKDANPKCPADEKYKALFVGKNPRGLYAFKSADGIHFTLMSDKPVITKGAFDSQNLAFWDPIRHEYREYHRGFNEGVRDIMTATTNDFLHWPDPVWLTYPGAPREHLYTNQIQPYYRAPHLFVGFPMRYNDRGWSEPMMALPQLEERLVRAGHHPRYGTTVTDGLFMTSRDGVTFKRWSEAFIRPGPRTRDTWTYGDNSTAWGLVETKSALTDAPNELSLYATEGYWRGTSLNVRRYTLRMDGFVSVQAPLSGGEFVTKPLVFEGGNLVINFETSAAGCVRVEIQDAEGRPIEGHTYNDCPEILGDSIECVVRWDAGGDVRELAGKPIRLRFVLHDADLYAFRFVPYQPDPERPKIPGPVALRMPKKTGTREPFIALEDDFQSVDAGTSPTSENLNPVSAETGNGWLISEGAADRVQILNDDPVGSGNPGTNHYMKAERRDEGASAGGRGWLKFIPADAAETENGIVEVRARIYVPSTNKSCVDIDAFDNPPNRYDRRAFHVRFHPDGSVRYYQGSDNIIPGITIKPDTWQEVLIRARMTDATFDLTIEGKTITDLPFADTMMHRIQTIGFYPNTNDCTLYVDDVRVKVIP